MTSYSAWSGAALPATAGPATVAPTGSRPRGYNGCSPYLYNGMLLRLPRPAAAAAARGAAAALRCARSAERSNFTWLRLANVVDEISGGAPIEDLIRCRPCSPGDHVALTVGSRIAFVASCDVAARGLAFWVAVVRAYVQLQITVSFEYRFLAQLYVQARAPVKHSLLKRDECGRLLSRRRCCGGLIMLGLPIL